MKKNPYIRFGYKLLILLAIMFVIDRAGGAAMAYFFEREPLGDAAAFSHAIENPKEDILIYGSSRALHTYDPRVFQQATGMSCFNCGRNASTIIYHAAILSSAISQPDHKPKAIILDLTPKELSWRGGEDGNDILAGMILPYVEKNKQFEAMAKDLFPKELLKAKVSKLYPYNSMILSIIRNYSKKGNDNIQGYQPLQGSKVEAKPPTITMNAEIDKYAKDKLEYFVKSVTDLHIPLFVIVSPIYLKKYAPTESLKVSKQILDKYGVPMWDYEFDTAYVKQALFYDNVHMNTKGAELFSAAIAKRVEEALKKEEQPPFSRQTKIAGTTAMVHSGSATK